MKSFPHLTILNKKKPELLNFFFITSRLVWALTTDRQTSSLHYLHLVAPLYPPMHCVFVSVIVLVPIFWGMDICHLIFLCLCLSVCLHYKGWAGQVSFLFTLCFTSTSIYTLLFFLVFFCLFTLCSIFYARRDVVMKWDLKNQRDLFLRLVFLLSLFHYSLSSFSVFSCLAGTAPWTRQIACTSNSKASLLSIHAGQ